MSPRGPVESGPGPRPEMPAFFRICLLSTVSCDLDGEGESSSVLKRTHPEGGSGWRCRGTRRALTCAPGGQPGCGQCRS